MAILILKPFFKTPVEKYIEYIRVNTENAGLNFSTHCLLIPYDPALDHIALSYSRVDIEYVGLSFSRHCPLTLFDLKLCHTALTYSKVNIENADLSFSRHSPLTLYDLTLYHIELTYIRVKRLYRHHQSQNDLQQHGFTKITVSITRNHTFENFWRARASFVPPYSYAVVPQCTLVVTCVEHYWLHAWS